MILQGVYIKQIFCCCHKKKSIKISLEKTTKISNRRRLISNIFSKRQLMYFLPISFNTISTSSNSIRFTRRRIDMNVYVMMNIFLYLTFTVTSYLCYFTHMLTRLLKIYFDCYIDIAKGKIYHKMISYLQKKI